MKRKLEKKEKKRKKREKLQQQANGDAEVSGLTVEPACFDLRRDAHQWSCLSVPHATAAWLRTIGWSQTVDLITEASQTRALTAAAAKTAHRRPRHVKQHVVQLWFCVLVQVCLDGEADTPAAKKKKKKQAEEEAVQAEEAPVAEETPGKKKKKRKAEAGDEQVEEEAVTDNGAGDAPAKKKKKRKSEVTEAEEPAEAPVSEKKKKKKD